MSRRKITFVVVALIVLLGGSAALSRLFVSMKPEPRKRPETEFKRFVKTEKVKYSEITSPLVSKGRVLSGSAVMLVSEASGKIQQGDVSLRKGTTFKKGQLLAEIYKDEVELALKARKSRFLTTISTLLPDLKVDYPNDFDAFQVFFNAIDMERPLPKVPAIANGQLKVFLASRNFLSEYYGILQDEKKLNRHSLYAPFNGAFTQVNSEVGAYVNTGAQIARMIRTDQVEVEVPVKNEESKWIKVGDKVQVFNDNRTGERTGTVVRKADFIDANTQSRSIFVKVPYHAGSELLSGEYKLVEFPGQSIEQAMQMARNAVFNTNEVFVVIDGKLKKRQINILKYNESTLIFNGLKQGEQLVVQPLINVKENARVSLLSEKPADRGERKGKKQLQGKEKARS